MKLQQRVKITGGMNEFVGRTGTVIDEQMDGRTKLYRVQLDTPVEVEGVDQVTDDLWSRQYLKIVRK